MQLSIPSSTFTPCYCILLMTQPWILDPVERTKSCSSEAFIIKNLMSKSNFCWCWVIEDFFVRSNFSKSCMLCLMFEDIAATGLFTSMPKICIFCHILEEARKIGRQLVVVTRIFGEEKRCMKTKIVQHTDESLGLLRLSRQSGLHRVKPGQRHRNTPSS